MIFYLKLFVADNVGKVEYSIFFTNKKLWNDKTTTNNATSYVIFYNKSTLYSDIRSQTYNINFPLIILQKLLEESFIKYKYNKSQLTYNISYGEVWKYSPADTPWNTSISNNNTSNTCPIPAHNFDNIGQGATWIFSFGLHFIGIFAFQFISEERRKGLLSSLRRIGLLESAHWASWFTTFQIILIIGSIIAIILSACIQSVVYPLKKLDLGILFMLLWFGGTASVCESFFLSSIVNSQSMNTFILFLNFIVIVFTLVFCSTPLNTINAIYSYESDTKEFTLQCIRQASSYNKIYSTDLLGNTFVQFLVFFLPWFHISQAVTDILSIINYGDDFTLKDSYSFHEKLSYDGSDSTLFRTKWVDWSFGMMLASSLIYLFLSWLCAQILSDGKTEGRSLFSVLFPHYVRVYLLGNNTGDILDGDVRGAEQKQSAIDHSVRVYKLSKTYSGVQALKEVSLSMSKGQLFVLLGHNGAGKSTLVNTLTGICVPTHGKVFVSGLDVEYDISSIQQTIGVCPQDDLLWDELTAREHMHIHASFKGIPDSDGLMEAVNFVLQKVQLGNRADSLARDFSGGMKRRLSVAMAMVGEVEVLFLDGMKTQNLLVI